MIQQESVVKVADNSGAKRALEALRDLTPETLAAEGYGRLVPMTAGQVVEIPQYIHYHLRDGLIVKAGCALA